MHGSTVRSSALRSRLLSGTGREEGADYNSESPRNESMNTITKVSVFVVKSLVPSHAQPSCHITAGPKTDERDQY